MNANGKWNKASTAHPCPICGKTNWCAISEDLHRVRCQRCGDAANDKSFELVGEKTDRNGAPFFDWRLAGSATKAPEPLYGLADGKGVRAAPEILDKVYRTFLSRLPRAFEFGASRGLSMEESIALDYRVLGKERWNAVRGVVDAGLEKHLPNVPGFHVKVDDRGRRWSVMGGNGVLIPVRDANGQIVAVKLRAFNTSTGKYCSLSSKNYHWIDPDGKQQPGPSPGAPLHFPTFEGDRSTIRVTEGELKADIATLRSGILTISIPGVNGWPRVAPIVRKIKPAVVRVAFDADYTTNQHVGAALVSLVRSLEETHARVELERWPEWAGNGIDDVFAGEKEGSIEILTGKALQGFVAGLEAAIGTKHEDPTDKRPEILVTTREHEVFEQALQHLSKDMTIFQRDGKLIRVARDHADKTGNSAAIVRAPNSPRIVRLNESIIRIRLAANIRWREQKPRGINSAHPPMWCVKAIAECGEYPGFRPLDGVVETPTLRPDGSVFDEPGYDPQTRLLYIPNADFPKVPENPSRAQVNKSVCDLLEVICDFPYTSENHRAGWLAALFTPLARPAFIGPSPLFIFDANAPGAGKSLQTDLIAQIVTGRPMPRSAYPQKDEEIEKRITATAIAADQLSLFDNVAGAFGSPSLDAVLTSTEWQGRILSLSANVRARMHTVWYATGNNVQIVGDTVRRVLLIRLQSYEEHPEDRTGFRHPSLLEWVAKERPRLVAAVLTILRGYFAAGCPNLVKAWGSFEGWSRIVRNTLVWAGLPDPAETKLEIRDQGDSEYLALVRFLEALRELDPHGRGKTTAEILDAAEQDQDLRAALLELAADREGQLPNTKSLGKVLARYKSRVVEGGIYISVVGEVKRAKRWAVLDASEQTANGQPIRTLGEYGEFGEYPTAYAGEESVNQKEEEAHAHIDGAPANSPNAPNSHDQGGSEAPSVSSEVIRAIGGPCGHAGGT